MVSSVDRSESAFLLVGFYSLVITICFCLKALDRGGALLKVDKLVTGHNADDIAETVLLNILRGDIARLSRCTSITTGEDGPIPRCKPFKYTYEKEIVIYPFSSLF